jgi:putative addiction module CopG family antidote
MSGRVTRLLGCVGMGKGLTCGQGEKIDGCWLGDRIHGVNVTLPAESEDHVASKVQSGLYQSASEVLNRSLRLMWHRDQSRLENLLLESEAAEESPLTKSDWADLRQRPGLSKP